jgi:hypothetical protein
VGSPAGGLELHADPGPDRLGRGEDTVLTRVEQVRGLGGGQDLEEVLEVFQVVVDVARAVARQGRAV